MKTYAIWVTLALIATLTGCTGLQPPKVESPHLYLLEAKPVTNQKNIRSDLVLLVNTPVARPGFDTPKMAYLRQTHELEYFVTHRWADTPARLLKPLLAQTLEPFFRTVVTSPGVIPADIKLETELIRLRQNFDTKPSQIRLTLRVSLIDIKSKKMIATQLFEEVENAASEDAYGGVIASNRALQRVLDQLPQFCLTPPEQK